jgi:hypothetical protein
MHLWRFLRGANKGLGKLRDEKYPQKGLAPEPMAAPDRRRAQDLLLDSIWGK